MLFPIDEVNEGAPEDVKQDGLHTSWYANGKKWYERNYASSSVDKRCYTFNTI